MYFPLGRVVATPAALAVLGAADILASDLLLRHQTGDWGDLDEEDRLQNDNALQFGGRLLSSYRLRTGKTVWIITEHDRSITTVLLPEDY